MPNRLSKREKIENSDCGPSVCILKSTTNTVVTTIYGPNPTEPACQDGSDNLFDDDLDQEDDDLDQEDYDYLYGDDNQDDDLYTAFYDDESCQRCFYSSSRLDLTSSSLVQQREPSITTKQPKLGHHAR